jgi:hypothetical protein
MPSTISAPGTGATRGCAAFGAALDLLDAAMAGGEAGKAAGRNIEPACSVLHSGTSPHDGEPR